MLTPSHISASFCVHQIQYRVEKVKGINAHTYDMRSRQEMYLSGGIMSVTSRILVVDMLSKRIATPLITGLIVLHAER